MADNVSLPPYHIPAYHRAMAFFTVYFAGLLAVLGLMTAVWLVSVALRDASIVDIFWGLGFVLAAAVYYANAEGVPGRKLLLLSLVTIWGVRLAGYIAWRNWGRGEDFRYQAFRQRYGPERYWWFSYFQVFLLQGGLIWLISAPLLGAQLGERGLNWLDGVGTAVWLVGFFFEAVGDWQLARFKADPANKGRVLDRGLWRYTRHPNYFGDAAVWWGYGLICLAAGSYLPALGALLMTGLIIRVSGVALLERSLKEKRPAYREYIRRTSPFFPWFPRK